MRTILPILCAAGLSACGMIYTNIHGPRSYRSATPREVNALPEDPVVSGEACNQSVLFLVAWGDGGYAAAVRRALEGRPDAILYDVKSDVRVLSALVGVYTKVCTRVTGKAARA